MIQSFLSVVPFIILLLGPAFGSFFAALAVRDERPDLQKLSRSVCDHCGHRLEWYELIPIVSYLIQRGKCRHCGKPLDVKLLFAELMGLVYFGILAVGIWQIVSLPGSDPIGNVVFSVIHLTLLGFLFYLAVYDLFYFGIPSNVTGYTALYAVTVNTMAAAARIFLGFDLSAYGIGNLDNLLAGAGAAAAVWLLVKVTREKGMGSGDILIALVLGLTLGWPGIISAFYITIFSAVAVGVPYAIIKKKFHGLRVPLVPFMVLGYIGALVWGEQIFRAIFHVI